MKSQAYCTGKEFAFKDKKNNNREMTLSAHTKDQILSCFCVSALRQPTLLVLKPPDRQLHS